MQINVLAGFNWNTVLSIVLFFVALGVLVTIHEFGHFLAAKSFKVYCTDFSIGFGPKIVKIKRKKGETTFSIGILPLGGYVSMLGEDDEESVPEGIVVSKERTLIGIKRYKRIIIMSAGIIMNFILAYLIFLISASCFPQVQVNAWYNVGENPGIVSLASEVTFSNNDQLYPTTFYYENGEFHEVVEGTESNPTNQLNILNEGYFTLENDTEYKYVAVLSYQLSGVNDTDISKNIYLFETSDENKFGSTNYYMPIVNQNGQFVQYEHKEGDTFKFEALFADALPSENENSNEAPSYVRDENGKLQTYPCEITITSNGTSFNALNVSFYKYDLWYGARSFEVAGNQRVQSSGLIGQALVGLFIGRGWDQLGGPLAIFSQTTTILENNPFYAYLNTWGVISVNLALFNLLPFPGLDGWQILVELVEGSVNGVRKTKYKLSMKKKEEDEEKEIQEIDLSKSQNHEDTVTANKDVNLTIGANTKKEEKVFKEREIPTKFKTIMSYVGLGLLLLLMIFVFIKDIIAFI